MHIAKIVLFAFNLSLVASLCALVLGLSASPGMAAHELRRELVPGLEFWSDKHTVTPSWETREAKPDPFSPTARHREFIQAGVPLEYRFRKNPYPAAAKFIHDGGRLYQLHCATCHGSKGLGDGEAGRDLRPLPAFLANTIKRRRSVDGYFLWTISDGGAQFGTAMPEYKKILTDQQIWQIVVYIRAGFPVSEVGQD
jgi:mono/diheme cytochrome c family protein